jgi:hypothetical protein
MALVAQRIKCKMKIISKKPKILAIKNIHIKSIEPPTGSKLSHEFHVLSKLCQNKDLNLEILLNSLMGRSMSLLTLIFSFPFLLPIPLPGLSFLLGSLIAVVGLAELLNKRPSIPNYILKKNLPYKILEQVFLYSEKASKFLEKLVRPRGRFFVKHSWFRRLNGVLIAFSGVLLALPLPPGTNATPALCIFLLSIAGLEEDMLLMIIGYLVFIFNIVLFTLIFFFGINGAKLMWDYLF